MDFSEIKNLPKTIRDKKIYDALKDMKITYQQYKNLIEQSNQQENVLNLQNGFLNEINEDDEPYFTVEINGKDVIVMKKDRDDLKANHVYSLKNDKEGDLIPDKLIGTWKNDIFIPISNHVGKSVLKAIDAASFFGNSYSTKKHTTNDYSTSNQNLEEKTNILLNSFIKPYEDRIKLLESQVASLSEIILTLITNNSPISPNITPINNEINEDPI